MIVATSPAAARPEFPRNGSGEASEPAVDYEASPAGLVFGVFEDRPTLMIGPPVPGETIYFGNYLPDLLTIPLRRLLQRYIDDIQYGRPSKNRRHNGLVVVIDPGHGGKQNGAVSPGGLKEKDLVLDVALRTARALGREKGVEVVMTRTKDEEVSLWDRVNIANEVRADLFVSIHANAFVTPELGGVETFFHSIDASGEEARRVASFENEPGGEQEEAVPDTLRFILQDIQQAERLRASSRLAHVVQEKLARAVPFENRGVMQADFIVLRGTQMASVLLELGFLTNPHEEKVLAKDFIRSEIARAIRDGVLDFWEVIKRKQGVGSREAVER